MQKRTIIKRIKTIIENYGSFDVAEVQADCSPCVTAPGNHTHLAEGFNLNGVTVNVYAPNGFSGDPIDDYELNYEELSKDILEEILFLADLFETDQEKTIKRCAN